MPQLTSAVPAAAKTFQLPLIRTPRGAPLYAIITSPSFLGLDTHFWKGHTTPCEAPNCSACEHGLMATWHGYLSLWNPKNNHAAIFEFTAAGGIQLEDYARRIGTLRGAALLAQRIGKRANGRLDFQLSPASPSHGPIPEPPNLLSVLAAIWRLPLDAFTIPCGQALDTAQNAIDADILSLQRGTPSKESA